MSGDYDITRTHTDLGDYVRRWDAAAAAFRDTADAELDVPYAESDSTRIDFFWPAGEPQALMLFYHGGMWIEGDRKLYSHLAAGPLGHDVAVGMVGYDLAPSVALDTIVDEARAAAVFAARRTGLPVVAAGHSAGGHLAAMVVADPAVPTEHGVAVSGIFDLGPMVQLPINKLLRLDPDTAVLVSPLRLEPPPGASLEVAVGELEGAEWQDQSRRLAERWGSKAGLHVLPGQHHLSVIEGVADPDDALTELVGVAAERAGS